MVLMIHMKGYNERAHLRENCRGSTKKIKINNQMNTSEHRQLVASSGEAISRIMLH